MLEGRRNRCHLIRILFLPLISKVDITRCFLFNKSTGNGNLFSYIKNETFIFINRKDRKV